MLNVDSRVGAASAARAERDGHVDSFSGWRVPIERSRPGMSVDMRVPDFRPATDRQILAAVHSGATVPAVPGFLSRAGWGCRHSRTTGGHAGICR